MDENVLSDQPGRTWRFLTHLKKLSFPNRIHYRKQLTDESMRIHEPIVENVLTSFQKGQHCHHFSIDEIRSATEDFKDTLIIGRGGYGNMYKGTLKKGTITDVAIKRLTSAFFQGAHEFQAQVQRLSMLQHPNIVSFIGYCDNGEEKILVHEYMSNETLFYHLHAIPTPLSWSRRLKICIDAARGLDYLHNGMSGLQLIHRDVKSSVIMFDNQWEAKITDLELSKLTPNDNPSSPVTTTVMGTLGYLDPEYFSTGRLSTKSDVYSFGVVLLEVLCRRKAMDRTRYDQEEWSLVTWALECLRKGKLEMIIDPDLRGQISFKSLNDYMIIVECCLRSYQEQRITMAEVVIGLESILALQQRTDNSFPQMGVTISDRRLQKYFSSLEQNSAQATSGSNSKPSQEENYSLKGIKLLSVEPYQPKGDHIHMSESMSEIDYLSEESYQLEGIDSPSEPNRGAVSEEFFSRNQTESSYDMMRLYYIQQADVLTRMKDFLHLVWFYPMKKEAEIDFGSLVDKFSSLNKYIRKSQDSSTDENYLIKIQTLYLDIEGHLDDAAFDMVAYLPELVQNGSGSIEYDNLSFWSGIPEIHASTISSARDRALRCIKDLKVKMLGISGSGAEEVVELLKDMQELRSVFDMVLFVHVNNHNPVDVFSDIEEAIYLSKKQGLETGDIISVSEHLLNCLLFVDGSVDFVDLPEIELYLSKRFQTLQIVMTSGKQNCHVKVDLEIRIQDHLLPWILFSSNVDLAIVGKYLSIQQVARRLVKECHGHLLAIVLLARALRGVIDVSVWELALQVVASQQRPSSSQLAVTSDVMVGVLRFIWSRLDTVSQRCIIQFASGAEFEKLSLIQSWIGDGLVKGEQEGEHAFDDLIRSFLLEQVGGDRVRMRDEIQLALLSSIAPRAHRLYLKQDNSESRKKLIIEEWDAREICLINNVLSEIPDNPKCPILVNLVLHSNQDLMDIPIKFFDNMPSLHVLDLSGTSIKCLPSSISKLINLQKLFIRDCNLMMELPPEIGDLKNLRVFDSEGTQLIWLPKQFGLLTKLECLKFSLYNFADRYKKSNQSMQIVPAADLSKLIRLKELSICMDSFGEWWKDEIIFIIDILSKLRNLESLRLYFPTTELLHRFMEIENWEGIPIYQHLKNFGFIVGHLRQRLISRLPLDLDETFVKLPKCVKYTNGEENDEVITRVLKHANALFIERHWTIHSLTTFTIEDMEKLKFCLLVECNEMLEIIHVKEDSFRRPLLKSLKYLSVHYMKSLSCIWNGPINRMSMSNLKALVMHACPELRTILTYELLENFTCLEYVIIEDCSKINTLISSGSYNSTSMPFLPSLKKISLLHLPELVSISDGTSIAPRLESLVVYDCPKLAKLSSMEVSDHIKEIKGENEWWDGLMWCEPEWNSGRPDYLSRVFIPLGTEGDIMDELADAVNYLPELAGS